MKIYQNLRIIGIDHGYGNMKTANCCFPTGVLMSETEPPFGGDVLVWNGRYYQIGVGHKAFAAEKLLDEDYYVLTLAAIARELGREKVYEADVFLAAGLPLTWVSQQKDAFKNYLLQEEYVTAINCMKSIALQQMILTKQQYRKSDKYIAWHGYQSFQVGEVDPGIAHKIGIELAKEMWGDRFQIVVTTHLDRDHIHNHFAFNSVSFLDGRKYNYSKAEQKRLRQVSDRLCQEHGLSVIQHPRKAPSRPVWLDEKAGKETRYRIYREDIRDAIDFSRSPKYMELYLNRLGYLTDFTGEHWKIRLPQQEHYTYLDTLDERWYPREITRIMGYYGNRQAVVTFPPDMPAEVRTYYTPHVPTSRIYRLHLYYCYELGILPKHTDYKPTSPYLKEDLRKLDEPTAQTDYMSRNKIETLQYHPRRFFGILCQHGVAKT